MKNILLILFLSTSLQVSAQEFEDKEDIETVDKLNPTDTIARRKKKDEVDFDFGTGLNFNFDDKQYQFNIGGFIQPVYQYSKIQEQKGSNEMNVRRAYVTLSGKALKEKLSFFIQTDFSLSKPLLDAWVAYHPTSFLNITAGQKRTFLNNKEMNVDENNFQFSDRSLLSTTLSNTGREFGLFVDSNFMLGKIGFVPQIALTSGDGRNSFGNNSNDGDKGGLKYGGRLDIYPFGYFSEGNTNTTADLLHENKPKLAIGTAISVNDGASNSVGEGHGDFDLYNKDGIIKYPNYRKFYADLLFKYQGFSFLGEYAKTSASKLNGLYTDQATTKILLPQQISSFLVLGEVYNFQAGYVTLNGYSLDIRYSKLNPEFNDYNNKIMQDMSAYTLGMSKYFKGNAIKIQAAISHYEYKQNPNQFLAELLMQIAF